jgi:hypothetical protein
LVGWKLFWPAPNPTSEAPVPPTVTGTRKLLPVKTSWLPGFTEAVTAALPATAALMKETRSETLSPAAIV